MSGPQDPVALARRPRLPFFFKQEIPSGPVFFKIQSELRSRKLNTVCEEARCPNRTHCYARGALTFQILGTVCTRRCGFCAEEFGRPPPPEPDEDIRILEAARTLKLRHVVVTAPARDDLADGGASAFARTVRRLKEALPGSTVEVLVSDFQGNPESLRAVFESRPDVFNHNMETVRRLTPKVRSRAQYDRSLFVLEQAARAGLMTKSGLMVGHGETREELLQAFKDLLTAHCRLLTIGQYLPPSAHHLPLIRFCDPAEFKDLEGEALRMGFEQVAAGPLVRSSYYAEEATRMFKVPS